ncbi:MAG: hypothetical protein H8E37_08035 [Planctomycetes bacterium]|nr:hypothetical protein [Planctomycetota bacterium]
MNSARKQIGSAQCIVMVTGLALLLTGLGIADARRRSGFERRSQDLAVTDAPRTIAVLGSDYRWQFQLPGPDGQLDTADDPPIASVLEVPPGVDVKLDLASSDYVYLMDLPDLKLKQICVPGLSYSLSFRTPDSGEFEMPVGNFCGVSFLHDGPMGMLRVSQSRDAWRNLGCRP